MGAGDLFGDLGQGWECRAGIFEPVIRHGDDMRAAMPFAHQPGAGLEAKPRIWSDPPFRPKHLCQRLQLAARRLAEPAVLKFLETVADASD